MDFKRGLVRTRLGYIHYRALGAGPAVMLFHINQQSSALMRELMQALARIRHLRHEIIPNGRFCMSWERATDIAARATPFLRG